MTAPQTPAELDAEIARLFVHACAAGCGERLMRPGTCADCEAAARRERLRGARVREFSSELPGTFGAYPDFGDVAALRSRVKDPTGVDRALAARAAATWAITIVGPAAAGKTHLAVALTKHIIAARELGGAYVYARDLAYGRSRSPLGTEAAIVSAALDAGALLLDDLDHAPDAHSSAVVDVIHRRHRYELPTVVTTTMGSQETAARHGDGVARRLFERVSATVIELRAPKGPR